MTFRRLRESFEIIHQSCLVAGLIAADSATVCRPRAHPHPSVLYWGAITLLNQARTQHFCDLILVLGSRTAKLARLPSVVSLLEAAAPALNGDNRGKHRELTWGLRDSGTRSAEPLRRVRRKARPEGKSWLTPYPFVHAQPAVETCSVTCHTRAYARVKSLHLPGTERETTLSPAGAETGTRRPTAPQVIVVHSVSPEPSLQPPQLRTPPGNHKHAGPIGKTTPPPLQVQQLVLASAGLCTGTPQLGVSLLCECVLWPLPCCHPVPMASSQARGLSCQCTICMWLCSAQPVGRHCSLGPGVHELEACPPAGLPDSACMLLAALLLCA